MYTFEQHLHKFAVWTAARATQRNFTTTKNIKLAIEATDLMNLIVSHKIMTSEQFDNYHSKTANRFLQKLSELNVEANYGQAAKIIAIYIKTAIVLPSTGKSNLARVAHPPIDSILLSNIYKKNPHLKIKDKRWTLLNESEYFELINELRNLPFDYFWEIERYWNFT